MAVALGDIITLGFAKAIAGISSGDTSQDTRLASLITACSVAAQNWCGRTLYPGYFDELYNGSGGGFLVLRSSPLIELTQVIIGPSTSNPQDYDNTAFDIDAKISKLSFKPTETADFFYGYVTNLAFPSGINTVEAKYYGGYGAILTASGAISTGSQTITVDAVRGLTANGDAWSIATDTPLVVDPGLPTQEFVTATATTGLTITATFAQAHAAGCRILVPVFPQDLQMGVGFMVNNLYRQKDFTKQSERLDQYAYTLRASDYGVAITSEVVSMLKNYKSVFAG